MNKATTTQPWRIVAAEIIAATKADPESLRSIYEDREFRPGRNASVWAQLSARLAQERKAYREAVAGGYLKEVQHSMLRRCFAHDYYQPGSYMITLVVPERGTNPFGMVKGDIRSGRKATTLTPTAAAYAHLSKNEGPLRLELTPLGAAILAALEGIPANYPMVEVRKAQIMPDHLHLILVVHAPIVSSKGTARHLGHVIGGFKAGCNKARRLMVAQHNCATPLSQGTTPLSQGTTPPSQGATPLSQGAHGTGAEELCSSAYDGSATTPDAAFAPLWAEGYTDTIILSNQHLNTEEAYLDDNIYRLRMKQEHRDLLRTVLHIRINGQDFAALGNINLLRRSWKEQVQFHHWEGDVPAGYRPCDRRWHCQRFYGPAAQLQDTAAQLQDTTAQLQDTAAPRQQDTTAQLQDTTAQLQDTVPVPGSCAARIYTIGEPIAGYTEAEAHTERLLQAGDGGAVFASPFISETEKAIRDAALTMGIPYIRLTREGFRDLYTPTKAEFEACCDGNLLILAPWEDRKRTATITRRECMELNKVAQVIVSEGLELTLVNDNNNNETIIPRDDD